MLKEATAYILFQATQSLASFLASKSRVYQLTASGQTSCYSLAKAIFEHKLEPTEHRMQRLIAIASGQYPTAADYQYI